MPAQAIEAIEDDVGGLIFRIIDLRMYSRAKMTYEEGLKEPDMSKRPSGPLIDRVRDTVFELARERIQALKESGQSQST